MRTMTAPFLIRSLSLRFEYVPVPSGLPTPYNISVGWNTIELDRGIY